MSVSFVKSFQYIVPVGIGIRETDRCNFCNFIDRYAVGHHITGLIESADIIVSGDIFFYLSVASDYIKSQHRHTET